MNARHGCIAAAGLALVVFSTPTPAPQVPDASKKDPLVVAEMPEAVLTALAGLTNLGSAQTDAIHALNARLNGLDQRISALERKKGNDNG